MMLRGYLWLLLRCARLLQWDYARRERWHRAKQVANLRAREFVINELADLTGDEQLELL